MDAKSAFGIEDTHGVLHRFQADFRGSSEGLGWSQVFASVQRERPFDGRFHALSDNLMVLHRGGPVDITYTVDGKSVARHIPRGGVFFLPAGHECNVALHAVLDSTHIYLRSDLFADHEGGADRLINGLAPMLGERDVVLEHLAAAVGETITGGLPASSLFIDPIAQAIANRFIAINYHKPLAAGDSEKHPQRLSSRQMQRVREFVETNLDTDIRLDMLAGLCGRSTEYFVRLFKATTGVSPYQYVLAMRIERAKLLLRDEVQSIADVALACGFSHQEHLTRMFRRFTGVTPGRYRRSH
ncbi:AraC family transcriptional regulator [Bradyrhizobium prioriisuperbiae]|uniref:AraC family transcriptional regulator n=1 Tax=Bradyrhizobium prioriisuperbiae TaxID=2854389 RepID=UPI0028EB6122|nr:AraC family transcriptional regulator [Bradyrhizobium prioritasuperba]